MKTNLKYVEIDETQYWKEDFLERIGAKKVTAVYVFDANRRVHCCELTPSYEMIEALNYTDNYLPDEDYDEFEDSWRPNFAEVSYMHCHWIDEIAKDLDISFECEEDDYYEEMVNTIVELNANGVLETV